MSVVQEAFANAGCRHVRTIIQSGNVLSARVDDEPAYLPLKGVGEIFFYHPPHPEH